MPEVSCWPLSSSMCANAGSTPGKAIHGVEAGVLDLIGLVEIFDLGAGYADGVIFVKGFSSSSSRLSVTSVSLFTMNMKVAGCLAHAPVIATGKTQVFFAE